MEPVNRLWSHKFFRLKLLRGDPVAITQVLRSCEKEVEMIESDIANLVYYMNGGLTYSEAWRLTTSQMKSLSGTISKHYEMQAEAYRKAQSKKW